MLLNNKCLLLITVLVSPSLSEIFQPYVKRFKARFSFQEDPVQANRITSRQCSLIRRTTRYQSMNVPMMCHGRTGRSIPIPGNLNIADNIRLVQLLRIIAVEFLVDGLEGRVVLVFSQDARTDVQTTTNSNMLPGHIADTKRRLLSDHFSANRPYQSFMNRLTSNNIAGGIIEQFLQSISDAMLPASNTFPSFFGTSNGPNLYATFLARSRPLSTVSHYIASSASIPLPGRAHGQAFGGQDNSFSPMVLATNRQSPNNEQLENSNQFPERWQDEILRYLATMAYQKMLVEEQYKIIQQEINRQNAIRRQIDMIIDGKVDQNKFAQLKPVKISDKDNKNSEIQNSEILKDALNATPFQPDERPFIANDTTPKSSVIQTEHVNPFASKLNPSTSSKDSALSFKVNEPAKESTFNKPSKNISPQEVGLPLRPPISQEPQLTDVSLLPETPELSIAPEDNQFPQSVMEGREKVKKIVGECLLDAGIDTRLDDLIRATNPIVFGRICRIKDTLSQCVSEKSDVSFGIGRSGFIGRKIVQAILVGMSNMCSEINNQNQEDEPIGEQTTEPDVTHEATDSTLSSTSFYRKLHDTGLHNKNYEKTIPNGVLVSDTIKDIEDKTIASILPSQTPSISDNTQTKSMYSKIFSLENKTNSNTDVGQDMKFEEMSPKIMKKGLVSPNVQAVTESTLRPTPEDQQYLKYETINQSTISKSVTFPMWMILAMVGSCAVLISTACIGFWIAVRCTRKKKIAKILREPMMQAASNKNIYATSLCAPPPVYLTTQEKPPIERDDALESEDFKIPEDDLNKLSVVENQFYVDKDVENKSESSEKM